MADFTTLASQAINADTLKLKVLNGRSYMVGPTVMAKECVMNTLLYTKEELGRSVGGWNGRPVTVGHPKKDGNFVSANSPDILEENQAGFIFDTSMRSDDGGMQSEVWLDVTKIDKFPAIRGAIQNGKMLEVSTGLFLDRVEKEGVFNGVKYKGVATNYLPDHLALLPGEIGACSIKDGAGFPRVNQMFTGNEVAMHERSRILRNKLTEVLKDRYFFMVDVFDKNFVYGMYGDGESKKLFARDYDLNKETGALTVGEAVEVFQKVEYPPITSLGANEMADTKTPEQLAAEQAAEVAANEAKVAKEAADAKAAKDAAEVAANEAKAKADAEEAAKAKPEVNAEAEEALVFLKEQKALCIKEILGNEQNKFTEDELNGMKYKELQKIASLAKPAHANVDRTGMGGAGGINASGKVCEEKPYIGA
jgi:hypothetical protein